MPISVLVVEDEPIILMNSVLHFEAEGFDVTQAAGAGEAIAILAARPDIKFLFTDIDMPGSMDGLMLSNYVRGRWPPVRIIVTSGKRMVEITDLPDGSMFFSKRYSLEEISGSMVRLMSATPTAESPRPS